MRVVEPPSEMRPSTKAFAQNFKFWFTNTYNDKDTIVPISTDTITVLEGRAHSGRTSMAADVLHKFISAMLALTDVSIYYSDEGDFFEKLTRISFDNAANTKGTIDFHQVTGLPIVTIGSLIHNYKTNANTGNRLVILFMDNVDRDQLEELSCLKGLISHLVVVATSFTSMSMMSYDDKDIRIFEIQPSAPTPNFVDRTLRHTTTVTLERNNQGIMMKTGDGTILQNGG